MKIRLDSSLFRDEDYDSPWYHSFSYLISHMTQPHVADTKIRTYYS